MPPFSFKYSWFVIGTVTVVLVGGLFFMRRPQDAHHTNPQGVTTTTEDIRTSIHNTDVPHQSTTQPIHTTPLPSSSLKTVEERQRYYDGLLKEDPESVWQEWKQSLNGDGLQREYANNALAAQLQKGGHGEIYLEAEGLLTQASLSAEHKASLVNLLTDTATPRALEVLLDTIRNATDDALRTSLEAGIEHIGDKHWGGRFHPELSPPMEAVWKTVTTDPSLLQSLAIGIAKVGAASGITLLLTDINGTTYEHVLQRQDTRATVVLGAMRNISNPSAVPALAQWFNSHQLGDAAFMASGRALSVIATSEATTVLLTWATQAPDEAAPLAREWLGQARGRGLDSERLMRNVISDGSTFRSQNVKNEIVELIRLLDSSDE